jgi:hypothetical protein
MGPSFLWTFPTQNNTQLPMRGREFEKGQLPKVLRLKESSQATSKTSLLSQKGETTSNDRFEDVFELTAALYGGNRAQ